MHIHTVIADIRTSLVRTFTALDAWFETDPALRSYRPADGGWTINEVLEHIALTSHFLLILVEKGTNKALQNAKTLDLQKELEGTSFQWNKLDEVGLHKSFTWVRPEHMVPTGSKPLEEVRQQLKAQLDRCLESLSKLPNGEGVLHRTTMTVNALGKINVYEYLYFVAQHGQRHITQMEKNASEFGRTLGQH